ncbi:winged helix-turn-helix transcriptional regulator [Nocardioides bizhenqiangii]
MVDAGLLERRRYNERPPRDEYVLTEAGHAFRPVLTALYAWGNQQYHPEEVNVRLVDAETGEDVDPVLVDRSTGKPLDDEHTAFLPGPAADDRLRAVLERRADRADRAS